MATHASAEKRHRQNLKRRTKNRSARAKIRTVIKASLQSLEQGNASDAKEAALEAGKLLDKAATRGLVHKNNARRRISRLQRRVASGIQ